MALVERSPSDDLMMFVIDVLRYDMENIEYLVQLLNSDGCVGWRFAWAREFTQADVVGAIERLLDIGMVQCYIERPDALRAVEPPVDMSRDRDALWFELTPAGWAAGERWDPPIDPTEQSDRADR